MKLTFDIPKDVTFHKRNEHGSVFETEDGDKFLVPSLGTILDAYPFSDYSDINAAIEYGKSVLLANPYIVQCEDVGEQPTHWVHIAVGGVSLRVDTKSLRSVLKLIPYDKLVLLDMHNLRRMVFELGVILD